MRTENELFVKSYLIDIVRWIWRQLHCTVLLIRKDEFLRKTLMYDFTEIKCFIMQKPSSLGTALSL